MATLHKRVNFFESEEGIEVKHALKLMETDSSFHTEPTYSANSGLYPDNLIPFTDKHMSYLNSHPNVYPQHYLSNLRLIARVR